MINHGWTPKTTQPSKEEPMNEGDASGTMSKVECATIQGEVRNDPM
jgi:hypothetical protein